MCYNNHKIANKTFLNIRGEYTMRKPLVRNISETNKTYLAAYEGSFEKRTSWLQYAVDCHALLEKLGDKDLVKIKWEDVEDYLGSVQGEETTKKNKRAHLVSFLRYVINNNLGNAKFQISKTVLFGLIQ
jgi:hypothetical protein